MISWSELVAAYPWLQNEYVIALGIIVLTLVIAKIFQSVLIGVFKKLTEKTETDIDDIILKIASRPIFFLILLVGVYIALHTLSVLDPYKSWVNGASFVLFVLIISWMLSRIFALLTTRWFQRHADMHGSPQLLNIIAAVVIYIAAFIVILSFFHIEITPLVAALGVGGLAVGLALQDTLGNVFAGIHIISDQPVRVHDVVELQGQNIVGTVEDIGWRSTRIKTLTNNIVVVPNSLLAGSIVTNYQLPAQDVRAIVECGVDYASDLDRVEKIALEVARDVQQSVPEAVRKFEPIVRFHTFADSNVNFRVTLNARGRLERPAVEHEFVKRLHKRFAKEGIEISWPVRKVYHHDADKKRA